MSADLFALERLRQNPDLGFEALRQAAEAEGVPLLPIHYGRARRQLGLANAAAPNPLPAAGAADATEADGTQADTVPSEPAQADAAAVPGPGLTRPSTPAFEFLVNALRHKPTSSYSELKIKADVRGLKIAPIMYGRAKALLGLVPVRPRGQGKNRKKASVSELSHAEASSAEQFAKQIEAVREPADLRAIARQLDMERRRLRTVLEQLATQIGAVINGS